MTNRSNGSKKKPQGKLENVFRLKNDKLLVRLTKKEPVTPVMEIKCERDDITTNLTE